MAPAAAIATTTPSSPTGRSGDGSITPSTTKASASAAIDSTMTNGIAECRGPKINRATKYASATSIVNATGQPETNIGSSKISTRWVCIHAGMVVTPIAAITGSQARRQGWSTPPGAVASTTSFAINAKKITIATSL